MSRAEVSTALLVVGLGGALTVVLGLVHLGLNRLYARLLDPPGLAIFPARMVSFLITFFPAFALACLVCDRVHRKLLGPRPKFFVVEYEVADFRLSGWLARAIYATVVGFTVIGFMNVPKHALLTDAAILDRRALALSTVRYPYAEIERVTMSYHWIPASKYKPDHVSSRRALYVFFRDGQRWSLVDAELASQRNDEQLLADYIAAKTGKPVEYPAEIVSYRRSN